MINKLKLRQWFSAAAVALALAGSTALTQAQTFITDTYTNSFDTGGNAASWIYWYNVPGNNTAMTFDAGMNASGASSGALRVDSPFTNATQNLFFGTFGNGYAYDFSTRADLTKFTNITFYIHVDPTVPPRGPSTNATDFGNIGVGMISAGYGYQEFGRPTIPLAASNGWVKLTVKIDQTQNNLANAPGICFNYNSYGGYPIYPVGSTNQTTFWIDNLSVDVNVGPPPPPPTVTLLKAVPGLTQFADKLPSYGREVIRTMDSNGPVNLTWYGQPKPVTYSFTIADFPGAGQSGFHTDIAMTPDLASSQLYADADWSATNALWFDINAQSDGSVRAGILWKTNQPSGNSTYVAVVANNNTNAFKQASAVGTWKLTFTSDTDFTITGPDGSTTNGSLPAFIAAMYSGTIGFSLFSGPGNDANIGQHMTFSALKITGVVTPVNEDLTSGALSTPYLILQSQLYDYGPDHFTLTPPNQQWVKKSDGWWLNWTRPDAGFVSVTKSPITAIWTETGLSNVFASGGHHWVLLPKTNINQEYFGLLKRVYAKLQVLLPGETAAPGTATGKTGTPLQQDTVNPFQITINAVDSTWHLVPGVSDQITVTCTDPGATVPPAGTVSLVNGTATPYVLMGTPTSTNTITVADSTDNTKTNGISSPIVVP